jgi:hypothetical protein
LSGVLPERSPLSSLPQYSLPLRFGGAAHPSLFDKGQQVTAEQVTHCSQNIELPHQVI